ncbi:MAG: hypothetical protein ACO201_06085 [Rickettsiales bacterium]
MPSAWDCAPKSLWIDEDRIGAAIAFPITAAPETSKDKQAKSFNPSRIPDDPFDRPMTSPLVKKITINISSSSIGPN